MAVCYPHHRWPRSYPRSIQSFLSRLFPPLGLSRWAQGPLQKKLSNPRCRRQGPQQENFLLKQKPRHQHPSDMWRGPLPWKDGGAFSEDHETLFKGVLPPFWGPASPSAMLQLPQGCLVPTRPQKGTAQLQGPSSLCRVPAPQPCPLHPLHTHSTAGCLFVAPTSPKRDPSTG